MRDAKRRHAVTLGSQVRLAVPWIFAAAFGIIARTAYGDELSVFRPAGQPATGVRDFFYLVFGITGAIFLLVEGALVYSLLRFRRCNAEQAEPAQVYGSGPLEVAWTVAPLLIVFVLFLVVVRSVVEAQQEYGEGPGLRVQVIGHQWWWEFVYPDDDPALVTRTANELHVPVGADGAPIHIELELLSADVIHSFWVPRLAGKTDLIPGRTNRMWFNASMPGIFLGQCAEFCGTQHANMKLRVVAEDEQTFRAWQDNERRPAVQAPEAADGRARFLSLSCVNCHTIRGTTGHGTVGPDLTHLMSRATLAAGATTNDRERLRAWLTDPDAIKPGSEMPNMHLSPADVELVASYLETLK